MHSRAININILAIFEPPVLFALLLLCSLASLLFYLMAIRDELPATAPQPT